MANEIPTLIIYNQYCKIKNELDIEFLRGLDDELSYVPENALYTKAYRGYRDRNGNWVQDSCKKSLMTPKLEFPRGLLERVKKYYKNYNKEIKIIDQTDPIIPSVPLDISKRLEELGKVPREHQVRALEAMKNNSSGIAQMSVGSGKTLLAAMACAEFNKITAIFVIGTDLLYQFYELFISIFGKEMVGILGDGNLDIKNKKYVISSVWTAAQSLGIKKISDDYDDNEKKMDKEKYHEIRIFLQSLEIAIFDECHAVTSLSLQEIVSYILGTGNANSGSSTYVKLYGLSGSPYKKSETDLIVESIFGNVIIEVSTSELILKNLLVRPTIRFISVPKYTGNSKNYAKIYKEYVIDNQIRNEYIEKAAIGLYNAGYVTLILYDKIEHGQILFNSLKDKISCELLSGKDSAERRNEVKEKIISGEIKCICASRIFDLGIDLPILSALIIAGPTKSTIKTIQRPGRILRMFPGKTKAIIVDFQDLAPHLERHSLIRKKLYKLEPEFIIEWPSKKRK